MPVPTSVKYYHDIDLVKNQILNAKMQPVTTAERNALASQYNSNDEGILVYDTTMDTLFVWDGNAWNQVGLTAQQEQELQDAYDNMITAIALTSTSTTLTVTLTQQDLGTLSSTLAVSYIHQQTSPLSAWTITHNLGKYPSVSVVDSSGNEVVGELQYINANQVILNFSAPFSGEAYLN